MKKIRQWLDFIGKKNLIAICALLVLVIAISVGIAISNSKSDEKADNEIEESTGLQVEENADDVEGDSIDFSEFQTEEEQKNNSGNSQSGSNGLTESPSGGDDDQKNTTSSGSEFGPLF